MLIGVCGGTGSGKSTIANKIIAGVGSEQVLFLQQDAYYLDLSELPLPVRHQVNFDHPDAIDFPLLIKHTSALLNGEAIQQPVYNFADHTRTGEFLELSPRPV